MRDFGTCLPIGTLIVASSEIPGERFLTDDVFSRLDGRDNHARVQCGWGADVDNFDFCIGQQQREVAVASVDLMFLREIEDMIAACRNRVHPRLKPMDPLVGIHVQFGDKAASDKTNSHLRHQRTPYETVTLLLANSRKHLSIRFGYIRRSAFTCATFPCEAV
jgi:hypothetical protein